MGRQDTWVLDILVLLYLAIGGLALGSCGGVTLGTLGVAGMLCSLGVAEQGLDEKTGGCFSEGM